MFNFHKPRTYRSIEGCCICRAKSSSSRFTDSRKYERDTMQCFDLKQPRQGEICNACVLLVKRFKRLPVGSKRNWSHVVDARTGGPGLNKIQPKYKSERISSRAAQQQQLQQQQQALINSNNNCSSGSLSPTTNNGHINSPNGAMNGGGSMAFITEKFSKIIKKSKKIKDSSLASSSSKRKSTNNTQCSQYINNTQSLPMTTTTDALDSDYEDTTRLNGNLTGTQGGLVVQFQTQTRASAYKAQAAAEARKRCLKLGTKRRKCLPPRKYRRSTQYEETLQFFDDEQWQEQKSCCGMLFQCPALANAIIIDIDNYKPCEIHQQRSSTTRQETVLESNIKPHLQKTIIQSMPAVVQLQPPQGPPPSSISLSSINNNHYNYKSSSQTPVLKKHHLFFKRQSECFPQGDMVTLNNPNNDSYSHNTPHVVNITMTESDFNMPQQHAHHQQQQHQQQRYSQQSTTSTLQRHIENAIHSSCSSNSSSSSSSINPLTTTTISSSSALSISVTSSIPFSSTMPQMPKHSLAKVTTISPPSTAAAGSYYNTSTSTTTTPLSKSHSFLHKIKDTGKIVKHSLEKFNTAVRLKTTNDLHEMKPIIKTVDKSYILAKPPTHANINTLNSATTGASTTYQSLASYNAAVGQPLTTTSLSAASPTSSTSSTSSTKFSDNSSDSGFDENMLDRKSVSPLHEDCDKKLLSRPGVQTMFLASGVQIQGQPQNLMLTGNEVAAKILQNRKYSSITTSPVTSNPRSLTSQHSSTTAVKIAQISTASITATGVGGGAGHPTAMSSAAQAKIRAIYNNNNTIQHENGITTIVPASSLAATSQISAMQNIAPSTVTITPAPPVGTQFNAQNHVISRKLTTANIINLQSNTQLSKSSSLSGNHHLNNSSSLSSSSSTNQKIILLKTSQQPSAAAAVTKYNTLQTTTSSSLHGNGSGGGNSR